MHESDNLQFVAGLSVISERCSFLKQPADVGGNVLCVHARTLCPVWKIEKSGSVTFCERPDISLVQRDVPGEKQRMDQDTQKETFFLSAGVAIVQLAGIDALKPGAACADVYKAAYDVLEEKHMGKYFRHSLGHGVGLDIHEGFNASPRSTDIFAPGNVTSIEPGIYIPGKFGVRIEDVCIVTEKGNENISSFSKELMIL